MDIERKLEMFAKVSENEAKQRRQELQALTDKRIKDALEQTKQEALDNAEKKLELELYRIKQSQKRELANHRAKAKKQVILRRAELLEELKQTVKSVLEVYTDSDEYREWLRESVVRELHDGQGATAVLRPADYEYLELMGTTSSNQVSLGGYRMVNAAFAIDNTFGTRLDELIEMFSGFEML